MDEIPDLKRKKEEERRGAGAPPWGLSASEGEAGWASGSGAARLSAVSRWMQGPLSWITSNVSMGIITTLAVAGSVFGLYNLGMQSVQGVPQAKKVAMFDHRADADSSNSGGTAASGDSVSYFSGANHGALSDGSQSAESQPAKDPSAPDSNAVPAAGSVPAQPDNSVPNKPDLASGKNSFMQRLGGGSGLAGGSGMSGGVAQAFKPMQMESNLQPAKPQQGKLLAMAGGSRPSVGRALGGVRGSGIRGQGVMGQLYNANGESGAAKKMSGEGSAYHAEQAFGGAPAGGGSSIGGSGLGGGASGGGTGIGGGSGEGPIGVGSSPTQPAPAVGSGTDVSPWTSMVMMAMSMLMVASAIITIIGILSLFAKDPTWFTLIIHPIMKMLLGIAIALAAISTLLGVMLMTKYGQTQQGAILTMGGAITMAAGAAAMLMPLSIPAWMMVFAGIAGIAASVGGMMGGHH